MIRFNTTALFGTGEGSNAGPASADKTAAERFHHSLSAALAAGTNFKMGPNFGVNKAAPPAVPEVSAPAVQAVAAPDDPVAAVSPFAAASVAAPAAAVNDPVAPPVVAGGDSGDTPEVSPQEFDDAYWAKQPPAVQALRTIDDYDQRMNMVSQLNAQGYKIDVPIMAWGWDPAKVTAARQNYGYTWVPSALQKPLAAAPGISVPGADPYDPKKPPAGSMTV